MAVYVAARFQHKKQAASLARELRGELATITSRWHDNEHDTEQSSFTERGERAKEDLQDLARSDVLVLFNPLDSSGVGTGGCHVETGYAIACWKPVVVVGSLSNVFHHLPQVILAAGARTAMQSARILLELQKHRLHDHAKTSGRPVSQRWVPSNVIFEECACCKLLRSETLLVNGVCPPCRSIRSGHGM